MRSDYSGHARTLDRSLDAISKTEPLSSTVKSSSFSLFLHASFVAALFAIPTTTSRRFSKSGSTQVISLQATQERPSPVTPVAIEPDPMVLTSELDSLIDRAVQVEPVDSREIDRTFREPARRDMPSLAPPAHLPQLKTDHEMLLKRRRPSEVRPEITITEPPVRPTTPRVTVEPPTPASDSTPQIVGLEREPVDLSANQPPDYPDEAVQKRLEGVVMLEITIDASGAVSRVEVLTSSGHSILDRAAMNAISNWKGTPAKRWGRAVESTERLPIRFRL